MGSFLIVLALVVFVLGELAVVVQKNRNRRADQSDGAESARPGERRPRRRAAMSMLVVGIMLFVISAIVIMNAVYLRQSGPTVVIETENGETIIDQQPSRDPRRVFALPVVLMIGGAALGLFVGRYRAEVKEWEELSEEESTPAAPTPEKSDLPPDAAQKKREELAHLLDAGLLTKEEYREKLKKLE